MMGRVGLNDVCINDFIETGPDLLNSLSVIFAKVRLLSVESLDEVLELLGSRLFKLVK